MTDQTETAIDRIPLTHSVHYVARGLPDVPNQYGPGVLAPSEITLTYRAAPDSQLGRVHAYVAGRIWVDGTELPLLPGGLYGQHYDDGLDGWPEWLAEEARLHDPATPAVPAGQAPADRAGLRERIGLAFHSELTEYRLGRNTGLIVQGLTDVALRMLPAPADRAAVLQEAADWLYADVDYRDRDLLGQRATAYQINTATVIDTEGEWL